MAAKKLILGLKTAIFGVPLELKGLRDWVQSIWLTWIKETITNKNILEGDTHITRNLYVPYILAVSSPFLTGVTLVFESLP